MRVDQIKECYYVGQIINKESQNEYDLSNEDCWILGRYVADGHIRKDKRQGRKNSYQYGCIISVGESKIDDFKNSVREHPFSFYPHSKSVYRAVFSSMKLVNFIIDSGFGKSALTKTIPNCILSLPKDKLKSFLDGYMSGDGSKINDTYKATTVSIKLALGLTSVVQKLYNIGCRIYYDKRPDTCVIEGRVVNQHDTYMIAYNPSCDRHRWYVDGDVVWYPVRKINMIEDSITLYGFTTKSGLFTANNMIVCS